MKGEDARFAHLKKDPRFRKVGKDKRKVKIDNRFKHMFTAPEFSSVDFMDKRGRKEKQVTKEKLEKFYEMSSEGENEQEENEENSLAGKPITNLTKTVKETASPDNNSQKVKQKNLTAPQKSPSDPEEDSESEAEEREEEEISDSSDGETTDEEEVSAEADVDAWDDVNTCTETTSESTPRVSICNLNWDRMNATDIFVLCNSALNEKSGSIEQVEVFPSQHGKAQLAKEQEKGPNIGPAADNGDDDGKEYSTEALRKYQIDRLKYYYAIVTCNSVTTADILYSELDGVEYQLSSSVLDLRFVPDDMEFDDDPPTSACYSMPDMTTYKPPTFITTALQNSSVRLTWDETPQSRLQLTTKKFSAADLETVDFSAYIASSESDQSEGEDGGGPSLEKYKALLAGIEEGEEDEVDQEMEITWTTGLEDNEEVVDEAEKNEERQENSTFYAPDDKDDFFATDTVIDRPKKKKKKKKKKGEVQKELTKEESELALLMESEKDEKKHFNMKKIVESKKEDDFKVDIEDDRFSAIKTSHHFAIDPSAPEYKATSETQKLRAAQAAAMTTEDKSRDENGGDIESNIIDKIKSRTAQFQSKKESSKLFKTKNKGIISDSVQNVSPNLNSDHSLKIKKNKKKGSENVQSNVSSDKVKKKKSPEDASSNVKSDDSSKVKKRKKQVLENVPSNISSDSDRKKLKKKKRRQEDNQSDEKPKKHKKRRSES